MGDAYTPLRGKCTWWREAVLGEDEWDVRLKPDEKRVVCSCFVEGKTWTFKQAEVPADCPENKHCRYYIRHY